MRSDCRICKTDSLEIKFDLGHLKYTGVFPSYNETEKTAPIRLAICRTCKLVQLYDDLNPTDFYKSGYGYESNINSSMRQHLISVAEKLEALYESKIGTCHAVIDIASNDGTLLSGYQNNTSVKIGIDPLIESLNNCYPSNSIKINKFFSAEEVKKQVDLPIDIVTSLSVFYDLNDPIDFAKNVFDIMSDNAIWFLEQSYLPSMIETLSYDTICHEHINYYSLSVLESILDSSGFKIIHAETNKINGGSMAVTAVKKNNNYFNADTTVQDFKNYELRNSYLSDEPLLEFARKSQLHMRELKTRLIELKENGNEIYGLGASTKGNVLLQCAGITSDIITSIGEVNSKKFGKFTPGTKILIVSESEILSQNPRGKVLMIIPWHFEDSIMQKLGSFIQKGGQVLVPLPNIRLIKS